MNRLVEFKYLALLLAVLGLLVAYPVLSGPAGSPLLFDGLLTGLILACVWAVFDDRRFRTAGLALAVPAVVGAWTGYALPDLPRRAAGVGLHLSAAVFEVFVVAVLLREVYRAKAISVDAIAGALCGYLLVGVAFGHVYCLVDDALPGSFRGAEGLTDRGHQHFRLTYFSFVTLATVGYGDITPVSGPARSLAVVEAVTGQFYLAVLVAALIGKRVSQPPPGG
jgi:hypothetical protein